MFALAGIAGIVIASWSSGPMMTAFSVIGAMALWKFRRHMRTLRWLVVAMLVSLNFVMNDPVYFLIARIDLAGGSTSCFRAQLIRSGIEHLSGWGLAGTDHTRHWMGTGTGWNLNHTDITNYYLAMGIWAGLVLLVLFGAMIITAFSRVGKALNGGENASREDQFLIWTLGAMLFGHAVSFFSVSYYDQTVVFLFWLLACIGSLRLGELAPQQVLSGEKAWSSAASYTEHCHEA
jgi:hypothetical protein